MFLLFLSTPTIVSVIEKSTDTSIFYSMTEEELTHKELPAELKNHHLNFDFTYGSTSGLILFENLSKHDNVSSTIFIPPPELV